MAISSTSSVKGIVSGTGWQIRLTLQKAPSLLLYIMVFNSSIRENRHQMDGKRHLLTRSPIPYVSPFFPCSFFHSLSCFPLSSTLLTFLDPLFFVPLFTRLITIYRLFSTDFSLPSGFPRSLLTSRAPISQISHVDWHNFYISTTGVNLSLSVLSAARQRARHRLQPPPAAQHLMHPSELSQFHPRSAAYLAIPSLLLPRS